MNSDSTERLTHTLNGKKRIPKACNACRHSKAKCDEQRPVCGRCQSSKKPCTYVERPKSLGEQRIEELEKEVASLRQRIQSGSQGQLQSSPTQAYLTTTSQHASEISSPHSVISVGLSTPSVSTDRLLKRKRSRFRMQKEIAVPDFVSENVLSQQQAAYYFECFFCGCDRFVPVFYPSDNFASIRSGSSILFNAICAVGCGVSEDALTFGRTLHVRLTRWLTTVVLSPHTQVLETVQALLVSHGPGCMQEKLIEKQIMACWWSERNLILAIAVRMAVDLQLDDAFDELVNLSLTSPSAAECHVLMNRARTWAVLWNLEQILQVDAGNLMGLKVKGVRRCRTLLDQPFSATLDARLFSQVELNSIRIKINERIGSERDDLIQAVQDARIDVAIWFNDWKRIIESSPLSGPEMPSLLTNLTVQRHWADTMAACQAIRATGVDNIDMMSSDQRQILSLAQDALQKHLEVILTQPQYLANLKYAMDFVWAKCAFSFLMLLKLSVLLSLDSHHHLLEQGRELHDKLSTNCCYGTSKIYLRLLQLSIDKYASRDSVQPSELDVSNPEEFVFDWDFPGLNLFSSQKGWDMLFDQYSLGDDLFFGIYDWDSANRKR